MLYNFFADNTKRAVHYCIELTFPQTATIALISGGAGWYGYQVGMTYSQRWISDKIIEIAKQQSPFGGESLGIMVAPLFVPRLAPYISEGLGLGYSVATSFTLNLVAQIIFGNKKKGGEKQSLPNERTQFQSEKSLKSPPKSFNSPPRTTVSSKHESYLEDMGEDIEENELED